MLVLSLASLALAGALVAALVYVVRQWGLDRKAWDLKEGALLQRIQAPETAVTEHVRSSRPKRKPARPIAADDDKAYAEREKGAGDG